MLDESNTCFYLPDLGKAAEHDWGWVLDRPFHEFVLIGPADAIALIVASGTDRPVALDSTGLSARTSSWPSWYRTINAWSVLRHTFPLVSALRTQAAASSIIEAKPVPIAPLEGRRDGVNANFYALGAIMCCDTEVDPEYLA
jgi:hypothetical protein